MEMLNSSLGEEILYISDEPAPTRRASSRWRVVGGVGAVAVTVVAMVPLVMGMIEGVRASRRATMHRPAQADRRRFS